MDELQIIIQGGAVGIAAFALWINYKTAGNHINHNTQALEKFSEAVTELTTYLRTIHGDKE